MMYNWGMNNINIEDIDKPYIDANYYSEIFKPNKNGMIIGTFNNVEQHLADFDSFRNRASELVDRILNNKITEIGGIDYVSPTPQMFIKKATAAIIQHWFISGYVTSDLDNTLAIGSLNVRQLRNNDSFRKLVPLDALLLIQKTGMWDNRVFSVDVTKELHNQGIEPSEIVLLSDALQIFQQKGDFDDNFHVDIDFGSELTGTTSDRWIKIIETTAKRISFEIMGGSDDDIAKALIVINKNDFSVGNSEAYIYSQNPIINQAEPNYFVKNSDGTLSFYVKIKDNIIDTHFLLSNIYSDDFGNYKLFGSITNSSELTELNKANILQAADLQALQSAIIQVESDIQSISGEVAKIDQNTLDIANLKPRTTTLEQTTQSLSGQQSSNTQSILGNTQNINSNSQRITTLDGAVIKKDGSINFDTNYTPTSNQAPSTKKYVDEQINIVQQSNQASAGFETEWQGSEVLATAASGNGEIEINISGLIPQKGSSFLLTNGHRIELSFNLNSFNQTETITTRIGNSNWDDIVDVHQTNHVVSTFQVKVTTAGIINVRKIDEKQDMENIGNDEVSILAVHQINGNVYSKSDVIIEDTTITELEGVTI